MVGGLLQYYRESYEFILFYRSSCAYNLQYSNYESENEFEELYGKVIKDISIAHHYFFRKKYRNNYNKVLEQLYYLPPIKNGKEELIFEGGKGFKNAKNDYNSMFKT